MLPPHITYPSNARPKSRTISPCVYTAYSLLKLPAITSHWIYVLEKSLMCLGFLQVCKRNDTSNSRSPLPRFDGLRGVLLENVAGNNEPLDFTSALVNLSDACVAVVPFHGIVRHVS